MYSRIIRILFSSLSLFLFLQAANCSAHVYESDYSVKITKSSSYVMPPSVISNKWKTYFTFKFNNGLEARYVTDWKFESQAKQKASFSHGENVNIIYDRTFMGYSEFGNAQYENFAFVEEKGNYETFVDLYVDKKFKFNNLPKIILILEKIEKIEYWFSTETFYHYEIRLTDGSAWKTQSSKSQNEWITSWEEGSEIIKIGNSKRFGIINKTKALKDEYSSIDQKDYFDLSKAEKLAD